MTNIDNLKELAEFSSRVEELTNGMGGLLVQANADRETCATAIAAMAANWVLSHQTGDTDKNVKVWAEATAEMCLAIATLVKENMGEVNTQTTATKH